MEKKVIVWDFSWIQKYLFDIQRNKSATKRLKWRSVFVEILLNKIKNDLITKLWNCEEYLKGWWKFIIICNDFDKNKFEIYKRDIEEKIYKQFYWELKIIFWVSDYIGGNFKNNLNKAFEDLEINKKRSFENIFINNWVWDTDKFIFSKDRWPNSVCRFSRWDLISKKNIDWYIKNILDEEWLEWIWENTINDIIISNYVSWLKWWNKNIEIFDWETIELKETIKRYLPKNDKWQIKSFEQLAWNFNKLACLKWDIDNLWKLLMFNIDENDYKKNYLEVSKLLEDFWNNKLYELVEGKDIYVVYAWWDDFLILGNWFEIINLNLNLIKEFKKYQKNYLQKYIKKEITFTTWINLFWQHDSFFTVVKNTEKLLKKAKELDTNKNKINIFWKIIENEDITYLLNEITKFEEKFINTNDKDKVSVGTLRFLLSISKKILLEKNNWEDEYWNERWFFEYWLWKSELFYHLWRNYKTKKWDSLKDNFRKYIDWMILNNFEEKFISLLWNDNLFNNKKWEKLFIMMTYLLYKLR